MYNESNMTATPFIVSNGMNSTSPIDPLSWYNYFGTSKPSEKPTVHPTGRVTSAPTYVPSIEPSELPTSGPSEAILSDNISSSNSGQNYELISSMTALISIFIIAAAFFVTKRHLLTKKKSKSKSKIVLRSPIFCDITKRVKERKKLMEEYFEIEAMECTHSNRSAASSVDFQISTEFIDITQEKQQSIY